MKSSKNLKKKNEIEEIDWDELERMDREIERATFEIGIYTGFIIVLLALIFTYSLCVVLLSEIR
jgi:hypothetical protein